jgi:hypothetical protein
MVIYNVWAYDYYYPCGPDDLKGSFMNRDEAHALAALIGDRGYNWDNPDFTPGDYIPQYDRVVVIETEVK